MWCILGDSLTPLTFHVLLYTWGSFYSALPTTQTHINTPWHLLVWPYKYHSLSLPLRAPSNRYWPLVGLIEGPSGLLVLLVNGDPATLLSQSTPPPPSLFYLSISALPSSHALGWFNGIDPLHLLTSFSKKIYWCSCPTLNTCWLFHATFWFHFHMTAL